MATLRQQLHDNAVALISLIVAVSGLAYNTWRNETTEEQRNVRHAAFRVLENLGELQQVVDTRYYYFQPGQDSEQREGELRISGYGHAAMIHDLMMLMPPPAPSAGEMLDQAWQSFFGALDDRGPAGEPTAGAREAEQKLTEAIREARSAVLLVLNRLD